MSLNPMSCLSHLSASVPRIPIAAFKPAGIKIQRRYATESRWLKVSLPPSTHRSSHVPTRIELNSSYKYKGEVTSREDDGTQQRIEIDKAITVFTVSDRIRLPAIETLQKIKNRNLIYGGLSLSGVGVGCALPHLEHPYAPYLGGALALVSGPLSALFFVRASGVSAELNQWEDPLEGIVSKRKIDVANFCEIQRKGLKGKVFSDKEIMHIWFRTLKRQEEEFEEACASGDPKKLADFIRKLVEKSCPFTNSAVAHAFEHSPVIANPKNPMAGVWKREDVNKLSNFLSNIRCNLTLLNQELADERLKVAQRNNLIHNAERAALQATLDGLQSRRDKALLPYQKERDFKLADLKKAYEGGFVLRLDWEDQSAKINKKYNANPEVVRLLSQYENNVALAKRARSFAEQVVDAASETHKREINSKEIQQIIRRFKDPVSHLFESFNNSRKKA